MIIAWIVITLLLAVIIGFMAWGVGGEAADFAFGFLMTLNLSFCVGVIYVAAHFIGKYW